VPSASQDSFSIRPQNLWEKKLSRLLNSVQPDSFISRESLFGWRADPAFGEGRRAGALFFACHRDYFIMTRNFIAIYRDLVPPNSFNVTRSSLPSTGTGKKRSTATQTAPN
jgi:hypothetical protein